MSIVSVTFCCSACGRRYAWQGCYADMADQLRTCPLCNAPQYNVLRVPQAPEPEVAMTLPYGTRSSLKRTKVLLRLLMSPVADWPRLSTIREQVRECLRHFPSDGVIKMAFPDTEWEQPK